MNILLWILAGLLAAMILLAGVMKVAVPKEKLLGIMAWAKTWPDARLKALAERALESGSLTVPAPTDS